MAKKRRNKNSGLIPLALIIGAVYLFGRKNTPAPPKYNDPAPQIPAETTGPAAVVGTRQWRRKMPTTI